MTRIRSILVVLLAASLPAGCEKAKPPPREPPRKVVVAASVFPIYDLVKQVGGEDVEVRCMLPPGISPWGAGPALSADALGGAKLVVTVGMGMDDWAAQAADAAAQRPRVVELTKDKDFLQSYAVHMGAAAASAIRDANKPGPAPATAAATASGPSPRQPPAGPDPYVWLNPVFMESFATTIAGELARLDPAHAPEFLRRARSFMDEADRIDKDYIERLAPLRGSHLVTWRPALGHIARRYGLVEIALSDGEGTYPSAARREEVRKLIANLKIKTVFADSQPAPGPLEELARQTGARVSRLDLIGGPASSGYESYSAMMRSNLAALVAGLKEGN